MILCDTLLHFFEAIESYGIRKAVSGYICETKAQWEGIYLTDCNIGKGKNSGFLYEKSKGICFLI